MYAVTVRRQKVSVTIPADLLDYAKRRAAGRGVSSVVTEALRKEQANEEQDRLEQALALDSDQNLAFARASTPLNAELVRNLDW